MNTMFGKVCVLGLAGAWLFALNTPAAAQVIINNNSFIANIQVVPVYRPAGPPAWHHHHHHRHPHYTRCFYHWEADYGEWHKSCVTRHYAAGARY